MLNVLYVAMGGAIGASLRYLITIVLNSTNYPYGTLFVNLIGSFAIGILVGLFSVQTNLPVRMQLFLVTGVLGGFTTFSSFSMENWIFIENGMLTTFISYVLVSNVGGIILAMIGYKIALNNLNF